MSNQLRRMVTRREVMQWMTGGAMVGCCPEDPQPIPGVRSARSGVSVDAHCHVFNAADLPVATFIVGARTSPVNKYLVNRPTLAFSVAILAEAIAGFLTNAPLEDAESAFLNGEPVADPLQEWDKGVGGFLSDLFASSVPNGPRIWTANYRPEFEPERLALGAQLKQALAGQAWPTDSASGLRTLALSRPNTIFSDINGVLEWCRQLSDFRIRIIDRLIELYGPERRGPSIFLPALVDFYRWLPDLSVAIKEGAPRVNLEQQVKLMERIIQLRPGFHPMLGVDPLADWKDTLSLLNRCFNVEGSDGARGNGFCGVKLYPPMGFSPSNNEHLRAISSVAADTVRDNLQRLYRYCQTYDVPIMAHCNQSNMTPTSEANGTYAAKEWRPVVESEEFRNLRINLAHFGGVSTTFLPAFKAGQPTPEQDEIGELMGMGKVYSDIADETLVVHSADREELAKAIRAYYERFPNAPKRLMYGSDWIMLGFEFAEFPNYLGGWYEQFELVGQDQDAFFGQNALDFMGVTTPDSLTQRRLQNFYDDLGARPDWLKAPEGEAS